MSLLSLSPDESEGVLSFLGPLAKSSSPRFTFSFLTGAFLATAFFAGFFFSPRISPRSSAVYFGLRLFIISPSAGFVFSPSPGILATSLLCAEESFGLFIEPGPSGVGSGCSQPGMLSKSVPSLFLSTLVRGSRSPSGMPNPRPPRLLPPMLGLSIALDASERPIL